MLIKNINMKKCVFPFKKLTDASVIVTYVTAFSVTNLRKRNNSTVFEELKVSIVNFTVANAVLLTRRSQ